ncbi:TetR/AcrR family transcriptional regulator [Cohnella sp. REN36]|uniref:TetR/AcrR family transcriptional regulator n=1 Tax=Cohnella sp. REN36 TaxID=2887347 RepID=UPI001D13C211|nr:TetR/AcrR family transcriptional regulator [Cohnella sp. REN36]MCC3376103.1 TetR/AcrR family transcriptional regulator [Cohnella sp. REN36]
MTETPKQEDRRTLRTKKLLRRALLEIIEEKGVEGITVRDLTDRAEINRGTFYLHYQDVPNLLDKLQEEIFAGLAEIIHEMDIAKLLSESTNDKPASSLLQIFEYLDRHADYFRVMLSPKGDISIAIRFKNEMTRRMYDKLTTFQPQEELMLVSREWLIAYVSSATLGVIQHWLSTGRKLSPYEIAHVMTRLARNGPLRSVHPRLGPPPIP